MDYQDINKAYEYIHEYMNGTLDSEYKDALYSVVNYADDCYVDHCEEIGTIAIENIKEMEDEWLDRACDVLHSLIGDGFVRYGSDRKVADNDQFEAMFRREIKKSYEGNGTDV